ncbi:MAG TPA: hypothetical protein VFV10_13315 [Gammaproteobacteria bacterium]|nr:hypothetical protein [Gammaproteobacteria bacterium]
MDPRPHDTRSPSLGEERRTDVPGTRGEADRDTSARPDGKSARPDGTPARRGNRHYTRRKNRTRDGRDRDARDRDGGARDDRATPPSESGSHLSGETVEHRWRSGRAWGTAWGTFVTIVALVILAVVVWAVFF